MSDNVTKVVLVVEYDGRHYYGFQLQDSLPTIQGELERALLKLTGEAVRVLAASRTDTGVHARGQVVSFGTKSLLPPEKFVGGLNYYLPQDIAVREAHRTGDRFNVRRDAVSREYKYYILNSVTRSPLKAGWSYQVRGSLDVAEMDEACRSLVGSRDFASFVTGLSSGLKSTVRHVYRAGVVRDGEVVVFDIEANAFLPHQVRNTVGTLIRVGLGKISVADFCDIIEAGHPRLAGPTVPACGLCLERVNYPEPFGEM